MSKLNPSDIRKTILQMAYNGQSGHIGSALSLVEIYTCLYNDFVPKNDTSKKIILSKGHGVMAQYAAMHLRQELTSDVVKNYFSDNSSLHGLAEASTPGFHASTGSMGHGLPIAVGMALGSKRKNDGSHFYCIAGDGEMNEGSMWEALLFASHQKLKNLTLIIDANGYQAMGQTSQILDLESLSEKIRSFGWTCLDCDGHDTDELKKALAVTSLEKPHAVVAKTIKGKGISEMEENNIWHYKKLSEQDFTKFMGEIS